MASALASKSAVSARAAAFSGRTARVAPLRQVRASAATRPVWYPGNEAPAHLNGTLAGDYGFDPLNLGQEPETLRWYVQAELVHSRVAMAGVAGILFTSIAAKAGLGIPEWYDATKVATEGSKASVGTLLATHILLIQWAELKRWNDFKNPGSQADGSFFGVTDAFKGVENGYPGGQYFDFMGLSRGDPAKYKEYKQKEITNGRLAMVAFVGFLAQHAATGKGPIDNLLDHLADPTHVTFATNGVSVPSFH